MTRTRLAQADVVGQGGLVSQRPALPHTGMSVADDFGGPNGVHSPWKEQPARRMALQVLKTAFGFEGAEFSGPLLQRATTPAGGAAAGGPTTVRFALSHAAGLKVMHACARSPLLARGVGLIPR